MAVTSRSSPAFSNSNSSTNSLSTPPQLDTDDSLSPPSLVAGSCGMSSCGSDMGEEACEGMGCEIPALRRSEPSIISVKTFPEDENASVTTQPTIATAPAPASAPATADEAPVTPSHPPSLSFRLGTPEPTYPQLLNNPPASPITNQAHRISDDKDEESSVPKSFDRSDFKHCHRDHKEFLHDDEKDFEGVRRMHKFTLYETATRFYIVGSDLLDSRFRILKIDRTAEIGDLSITEDGVVYTREETARLLATIEDGNISTGGLKQKCPFWGLLGFIRFTGAYYMLLITKRSIVAMIGGHYVYQIDNTELVPLTAGTAPKKPERNSEEARFVSILGNLDLTRSFYFSYSYDITRTLQHNIIRQREALSKGLAKPDNHDYNDMFAWNHYLLEPAKSHMRNAYDWCMPIVHGYVDQAAISIYGRVIYITVIARRSRYFAGARFLKRGANDLGYVANDVETEQIVSEMLTTSFHAPMKGLYSNPNYTSYVQHRGSIPLFWTQKNDAATPKPPVEMNLVDPFFSAAALHFDDLFQRYGSPVIVLNLVKSRERTPRESLLLKEFTQAINYLNQFLPTEKKIRYIAWDMSRASKSRDQDVIETLETIAENVLNTTGFFHNGLKPGNENEGGYSLQNGVCRTNCIDCLDRTNAAQFVIGKRALGHQLHALGVISGTSIDYDTDAVNLFTHMYHDHGDTIAVQYAGSHLVNTMETYRKINQWTSHSRDMLESFKRYYNNSFLDGQRQEAYNLFLGNYIFAQGQPMLWDLSTDYYLHHADPRLGRRRRSYVKWWTPKNLVERSMSEIPPLSDELATKPYSHFDDYWLEYYRPKALSSFQKVFTYDINSTLRYIPVKMTQTGRYDLSPFTIRSNHVDHHHAENAEKKAKAERDSETAEGRLKKITALHGWHPPQNGIALPPPHPPPPRQSSSTLVYHQPELTRGLSSPTKQHFSLGKDLMQVERRDMNQAIERSLNPVLGEEEAKEYERYMSHPLTLPLVVTSEPPADADPDSVYFDYVNNTSPEAAAGMTAKAEDVALYDEFVIVPENPLSVDETDRENKRYIAYQRWITTGNFKHLRNYVGSIRA
ncbi:hypothetical protein L873DRAFT_1799772 [Choiromyces venosus 120613-1]|uniref:SAC domain-containing protein n=1 Tax=Choiromyces venosus 120613-1 TaxID=1336337 RepID=A0A3N4K156_9PEZI|nr:hypothetical protein L873DRAFT_1799772 [Choiromyces venosus 120613-1]